jgi:hypothetical protein
MTRLLCGSRTPAGKRRPAIIAFSVLAASTISCTTFANKDPAPTPAITQHSYSIPEPKARKPEAGKPSTKKPKTRDVEVLS